MKSPTHISKTALAIDPKFKDWLGKGRPQDGYFSAINYETVEAAAFVVALLNGCQLKVTKSEVEGNYQKLRSQIILDVEILDV